MSLLEGVKRGARRGLAWIDAGLNRVYGWRYNPLYHSGAVVLVLVPGAARHRRLLCCSSTTSASRTIPSSASPGRPGWGAGCAACTAMPRTRRSIAAAFHALRMLVQGRSWGPRTLAWISGLVLLGSVFICGWTGFVMVWDVQGQVLAQTGARIFDLLPIFGEPISRAFTGERALPGAFFFLNLFAHVALPIGLFILVWVHVSRLARPGLFPPRRLTWWLSGALLALAVFWPVAVTPPADAFMLPGRAAYDWFYAFWVPLARAVSPGAMWGHQSRRGGGRPRHTVDHASPPGTPPTRLGRRRAVVHGLRAVLPRLPVRGDRDGGPVRRRADWEIRAGGAGRSRAVRELRSLRRIVRADGRGARRVARAGHSSRWCATSSRRNGRRRETSCWWCAIAEPAASRAPPNSKARASTR